MHTKKIKVAFLGGRILGYECLKVLNEMREYIDVKFVLTSQKDGEIDSDWNPEILPLARKLGFNTLEIKSLKSQSGLELFNDVDVILNPFCSRIIPKEILDKLPLGAINFHFGKLPEYQGRFIVTHVIINDEQETAVTVHYMSSEVDTGDIIFEEIIPVEGDDTAKDLYMRCSTKGVELFRKVLNYLIKDIPLPRKKQIGIAHYYANEEPNGCLINFFLEKEQIERFIRATTFPPISNPHFFISEKKYNIYQEKCLYKNKMYPLIPPPPYYLNLKEMMFL